MRKTCRQNDWMKRQKDEDMKRKKDTNISKKEIERQMDKMGGIGKRKNRLEKKEMFRKKYADMSRRHVDSFCKAGLRSK